MNETEVSAPNRAVRSAVFYNSLHRYRNLLRKLWWVLVGTLLLGLGIAAYLVWITPASYVSFGRMIMSIKINTTGGTGSSFTEELNNFLGTQAALMKSAGVLNRARERVRTLKPDLVPAPVDLEISVTPKTTIFNLRAVSTNSDYTVAFLDACMEEYSALKSEMRATMSDTTLSRITDQVEGLDRDIKKIEAEEAAFATNNNIVFVKEQVASLVGYMLQKTRQLDAYRNQYEFLSTLTLDQILDRQQSLAPKIMSVQKSATGQKPDPRQPATAQSSDQDLGVDQDNYLNTEFLRARQDLLLRRADLDDWAKILRPKHPRMVAMNEDIVRRENLLRIFKDQSKEQLAGQRDSLSMQITNLVRETKALEVEAAKLSNLLEERERIAARKLTVQNLRDNLQRAMQSLGAEKDINQETVTTLEHASVPLTTSIALKVTLLGAVLGLGAGLFLLFIVDRLDDRPGSYNDLHDLFDEPIMGQIPYESSLVKGSKQIPLLKDGDDRHMFLEAYRNLRSSLLYMATQGKRPKILVVTSSIPGDGKSLTTANLAITMALAGARVLLVDADLRKGGQHRGFGIEPTPGLSEALNGKTPIAKTIVPTFTPNLFLIPRGETLHNPGELFVKPSTHSLIAELAAQYDYVIFDTAPVMAADDVTSLSPHVEGVLFVVRANYTSGRVARAALDLLYQREINVLGLVFNGVQTRSNEYYYYRYKEYYAKSA